MDTVKIYEIDSPIKALVDASIFARNLAYSPYSKFKVGAALLCDDGEIVTGCNVDNISLGLSICAERVAVFKAISQGIQKFTAIAVCGVMDNKFVTPCGACRQVLAEFNSKILIYLHNPTTEQVGITTMLYLLPEAFSPENISLNM